VWSMGDDTPIPPLSRTAPSLYAYFRQRFAQVTNPPIDPLRETLVMSLRMHLGRRGSLLSDRPSVGWRAAAGGAGGGGAAARRDDRIRLGGGSGALWGAGRRGRRGA